VSPNNIPHLQIQQQLLKEALYGCAICGCPIVEYANIVPYDGNAQAFLPENMLVLCPSHYMDYSNHRGISESALRDAKNNPHNKVHQEDAFIVPSQDLAIIIGKCKFINTSRILVIDDFDIISIKREEGKYILLDINFFDKLNNLIAIVSGNSWTAEKSDSWTINYKAKHLTIQNQSKNIIFETKIEDINNEITIIADGMCYNRSAIKIKENQILLDGEEIALDLKDTELKNYEVGIEAETL
jgi:hypothetical protein